MLMPEAVAHTRKAQPVDDGRRLIERAFLQQTRSDMRRGHRRQKRFLLLSPVPRDEPVADAETEMFLECRGRLVFVQKIAHEIDRQTAVENFIFPKRLQAKRPLLLGMQPRQRPSFEQDQFGFGREEFFVNDDVLDRIIFRRDRQRAVGRRVSPDEGRKDGQGWRHKHGKEGP